MNYYYSIAILWCGWLGLCFSQLRGFNETLASFRIQRKTPAFSSELNGFNRTHPIFNQMEDVQLLLSDFQNKLQCLQKNLSEIASPP
jgi:hypothetical protein